MGLTFHRFSLLPVSKSGGKQIAPRRCEAREAQIPACFPSSRNDSSRDAPFTSVEQKAKLRGAALETVSSSPAAAYEEFAKFRS